MNRERINTEIQKRENIFAEKAVAIFGVHGKVVASNKASILKSNVFTSIFFYN